MASCNQTFLVSENNRIRGERNKAERENTENKQAAAVLWYFIYKVEGMGAQFIRWDAQREVEVAVDD